MKSRIGPARWELSWLNKKAARRTGLEIHHVLDSETGQHIFTKISQGARSVSIDAAVFDEFMELLDEAPGALPDEDITEDIPAEM